jgi:hypothetical protein
MTEGQRLATFARACASCHTPRVRSYRPRWRRDVAAVSLVAVTLTASLAVLAETKRPRPPAAEPDPRPDVAALIEGCLSETPNVVLELVPGKATAYHESPNDQYGSPTCDRYVIDVPLNASAAQSPAGHDPRILMYARDWRGPSWIGISNDCRAWNVSVIVYKRGQGEPVFRRIGSVYQHGEWVDHGPNANTCIERETRIGITGADYLQAPANGTDVYRLLARSDIGKDRRPLIMAAFHPKTF